MPILLRPSSIDQVQPAPEGNPTGDRTPQEDNRPRSDSLTVQPVCREVVPPSFGVLGRVETMIRDYCFLSYPETYQVVAAWVLAAWLAHSWDMFPHLAITSPEIRCGKSHLLRVLGCLCPDPYDTVNTSVAAVYRSIDLTKPYPITLFLDEVQALYQPSKEDLKNLFCAGIEKTKTALRCESRKKDESYEPRAWPIYCPKVLAGLRVDRMLADRCISVPLKTALPTEMPAKVLFDRDTRPRGEEIKAEIRSWFESDGGFKRRIAESIYHDIQPLDIRNARMQELLLPLQAVLYATGNDDSTLKRFALRLEDEDRKRQDESLPVRLLADIQTVFNTPNADGSARHFMTSKELVKWLVHIEESPWGQSERGGRPLNMHTLALRLKGFDIKPDQSHSGDSRGYYKGDFLDAWSRYVRP